MRDRILSVYFTLGYKATLLLEADLVSRGGVDILKYLFVSVRSNAKYRRFDPNSGQIIIQIIVKRM